MVKIRRRHTRPRAASFWLHLIFPISWSSDWGPPYSQAHFEGIAARFARHRLANLVAQVGYADGSHATSISPGYAPTSPSKPTPNSGNPSTIPTVFRLTLITFPINHTTYSGTSPKAIANLKFSATVTYLMGKMGKIQTLFR